ncbi:choline transporter-like protein 5-B [Uloborus diversus]|uniref:choline transporter-like protein 5-B n=1 Tax=Uloborus diversus TaxID=327109 RepID=UPI00240A38E2|nr:choline transporter-like protein 5-B [Uloborus diversus]
MKHVNIDTVSIISRYVKVVARNFASRVFPVVVQSSFMTTIRSGDPRVLLYPTDSDGNLCGTRKAKVCVETCPNETFVAHPSMPGIEERISQLICKYDARRYDKSFADLISDEDCAMIYIKSKAVLGVCIPKRVLNDEKLEDENNISNETKSEKDKLIENGFMAARYVLQFLSSGQLGEKIFQDFLSSWHLILIGLLISMLVSLIWTVLLRWIAAPLLYSAFLIVLAACAFGGIQCVLKYLELKGGKVEGLKLAEVVQNVWLALAVVSALMFFIFLLLIIFFRKNIKYAVALVGEASKAVGSMFTTLIFPVISYAVMLALFAIWVTIALYIASSGKASFVIADAPEDSGLQNGTICNPKSFQNNASTDGAKCIFQDYGLENNLYTAHIYNTVLIIWALVFLICLSHLTMAGAFGDYYWTLDKSNINRCSWIKSLYYAFRYHLGSIAFGSLVIGSLGIVSGLLQCITMKARRFDNVITRPLFK